MSHPQRLERLRASLATRGLDGLLISQPESRYYLSGYAGHDLPPRDSAGYLLITQQQALLLTDPRTTAQAEQEAPDFEVLVNLPTRARPILDAPGPIRKSARYVDPPGREAW